MDGLEKNVKQRINCDIYRKCIIVKGCYINFYFRIILMGLVYKHTQLGQKVFMTLYFTL